MKELIIILLLSVIIGMVTNAVNIITSNGNLLGFIQDFIDKQYKWHQLNINQECADKYLFRLKPFFLCPPCMASVWGSAIFFGLNHILKLFSYDIKLFGIYIVTILVGSFASYLFAKFNHNV